MGTEVNAIFSLLNASLADRFHWSFLEPYFKREVRRDAMTLKLQI